MPRPFDFFRRRASDADIEEEVRSHLTLAIKHRVEDGQATDDARRAALREFSNVQAGRDDVRGIWRWTAVEQLLADLLSGARILTRSPGLSAVAVALIALVIGGNTTIFSMVHGLLTKPAPAITADDLVSLGWSVDRQPVRPTDSYANYVDVAAQARTVRPMLAFQYERFTLTHRDGSYALRGAAVTPGYFETLGLPLARGRAFTRDEEDAAELTVIISHRVWVAHFQQSGAAIGERLALNGMPATIIGVAPPRFEGVWLVERSDVWVPLAAYARARGQARTLEERAGGPFAMLGRLAPGVSLREARTELATIAARLQAAYPDANKGKTIVVLPYSATAAGDSPLAQGGPRFLAIFSIVTALTLLIVCANVANLMLGRAVVRQRELAVRQSFGASRLRVIRLVLAEGIAIAAASWGVACLFAWTLSKALARLIPPSEGGAPFVIDFTPDWKVLAYAMVLAAGGTVAFTIGPAVHAWRQDLLPFLKAGEQGIVPGRSRLATGLVVLQLAFAVLLLAGAGLAYRSFSLAGAIDLGFNRDGLLLVTIKVGGVPEGPRATLLDRMRERLRSVPGVDGVTYARTPPKEYWSTEQVGVAGAQRPIVAERNSVGPDYLRVLGVAPRLGREFSVEDRARPIASAMINDTLAQALWPGGNAIGRTLLLGPERRPVEVIAVAPNAFFSGFRREEHPYFVFLPMRPDRETSDEATFYVRYGGSLDPVAAATGRALADVDSRAPIVYMRTMETQLASITAVLRMLTTMLVLFAGASLFIATLGQYAALAFTMRRRTRDFGLRMALGASAHQVLGSVIWEGLRLTIAGLAIGTALSLLLARALRSVLVGVTPTDPSTYLGVVAVLASASMMACWLPAWRASRVEPMEALREE